MREALPRKQRALPVSLLVGCCALVGAMPMAANAQDFFDPAAVNLESLLA